jgi:hypothetical protein
MQVSSDTLFKTARKLLEVFARQHGIPDAFVRYWLLSGPLEAFAASATTPFEKAFVESMRKALEGQLRLHAPYSNHEHAKVVARVLRPVKRIVLK